MAAATYHKYRSLDTRKFVLDAFVHRRLYAATFDSLNDPMEGRYHYFGDAVSREFRRAVLHSRAQRRICSLSKNHSDTLLWSYSGGAHKGVALEIRLPPAPAPAVEVRDAFHDHTVNVRGRPGRRSADAAALDILSQKQWGWQHEQEVRVFTAETHVPVKPVELVLGCLIDRPDEGPIVGPAKKWHPRISVKKLDRSMLDVPLALDPLGPPGQAHAAFIRSSH